MLGRRTAILVVALLLGAAGALAQTKPDSPEFDVKEHYTKYEYRIPMRDGVHLFTAVYVPKDSSRAYPFLINRTPYSVAPYGVGSIPRAARTLAGLRQSRLHFRDARRSRPLHVGRHVRRNAPAH